MSLRVVSVSGPAHLSYQDKALQLTKVNEQIAKIPLEDIAVILLDGHGLTLSHDLISACATKGVAIVSSDERHLPNGVHLPLSGHSLHTATLRAQIESKRPQAKRAWQSIVRAKILAQASLLKHYGLRDEHLRRLAAKVRSGDPDNLEAAAAIPYFSALFGPDFVRERDALGLNALLNYGYALLRAATARAIVGAGLHPALGVHHHNKYNPHCLADDAMEPLRPLADHMANRLLREQPEIKDLTPNVKRRLAEVLASRVQLTDRSYPLLVGLERYGADLRRAICEGASLSPPRPLFDP